MVIDDAKAEQIRRIVESGTGNRVFWLSCSPEERLYALELMRQKTWGYDENSMPRLDRSFFEIVTRVRGKSTPAERSKNPATQ